MTVGETEPTLSLVVGHKRDGRCVYSRDAKRALVEACLKPGVSLAKVARRHDLNANVLRRWVILHQRERPPAGKPALEPGHALLPVVVAPAPIRAPMAEARTADSTIIEIEVAGLVIRIRGAVDRGQLQTVLACVRSA